MKKLLTILTLLGFIGFVHADWVDDYDVNGRHVGTSTFDSLTAIMARCSTVVSDSTLTNVLRAKSGTSITVRSNLLSTYDSSRVQAADTARVYKTLIVASPNYPQATFSCATGDTGMVSLGGIGTSKSNAFVGGRTVSSTQGTLYLGDNLYNNGAAWVRGNTNANLTAALLMQNGEYTFYTGTTTIGTVKLYINNAGRDSGTVAVRNVFKGVIRTFAVIGTSDTVSVANASVMAVNTAGGSITIGGFIDGVAGQILHFYNSGANNVVLEDNESSGNQDIKCNTGADVTIAGPGGGTLICDGSFWWLIASGL